MVYAVLPTNPYTGVHDEK